MESIEHYGALRGSLMAAWRVLRCHPFARGGYDPVKIVENSELPASGCKPGLCGH